MYRRTHFALVAIASTISLAAGCAGRTKPVGTVSGGEVDLESSDVIVRVQNNYLDPVRVYAVVRGLSQRLGTVGIGSPSTFRIPASRLPPDRQIQIVATPFGGTGRATSGALTISGGTVIEFTVGPTLVGSVLLR